MTPDDFSEPEKQFIVEASHELVKQRGLAGNAAALGLCVVAKIQKASNDESSGSEVGQTETDTDS